MVRRLGWACVIMTAVLPTTAAAQEASKGPAGATTAAFPAGEGCFPTCRAGYLCHAGQCISRCNPACPSGTDCTDDLRCAPLSDATSSTPAPTTSTPPAPSAPAAASAPAPEGRRPGRPSDLVLRLTLGPAFVVQRGSASEGDVWNESTFDYEERRRPTDGTFVGQTGELSLGSIQVRRVIVGGNLMETVAYNEDQGIVNVSLGTYVDFYPVSERGFHLRGDISMGVMAGIDDEADDALYSFGALVGAGYDTWVSEGWALGVLARLQYVGGFGENQIRHLFVPTISLSASYGPISW